MYFILFSTCLFFSSSQFSYAEKPLEEAIDGVERLFNDNINKFVDDLKLVNVNQNSEIVCRHELTGESLDWFTLYKLPKITDKDIGENNRFFPNGTAYAFMTNKNPEWTLSDLSINDTNSFPGRTLETLYRTNFSDNDSNVGYILYNDQADKVTLIQGHTKGVLLFNEKSAVWIVHSIPHYPPKADQSEYCIQPSQCVYGQSMLCMSFNFEQLEVIGEQLLYNYPQVYDFHIPSKLKSKNSNVLQNLLKVLSGEHIKQEPWFNMKYLTTIGGEKMLSFAKFTQFQDDLYSGIVAPKLESNLYTETWNNGAGTLKSNCSMDLKYHVMNIEQIKFDKFNVKFSVHRDHSKWAVTSLRSNLLDLAIHDLGSNDDEEVKIACVGDINRQEEQFKRGGGTVCFLNNTKVWQQYFRLVGDIEACEKFRINKLKFRKFKAKKTSERLIVLGK